MSKMFKVMKNCLVTKLNAIVPDPDKSMEYFGGFFIERYFNSIGDVKAFQLSVGSDSTVEIFIVDGDADFVNSTQNPTPLNPSNKLTINSLKTIAIKSKVAGYVRVFVKPDNNRSLTRMVDVNKVNFNDVEKYVDDFTYFRAGTDSESLAANEFYGTLSQQVCERLTCGVFQCNKGNLVVNLNNFANNTTLGDIGLNLTGSGIQVIGSIESLGKAITLKAINVIDQSAVTGNISALAEAMIANGRNNEWAGIGTNELTIRVNNSTQITIDGTNPAKAFQYKITFNSELPNGYSITVS